MNQHRVMTWSTKVSPLSDENRKKNSLDFQSKKNQKDVQVRELMKKCVKEWCENTTSHGFSNMVRTDSWIIRIIWFVLVLVFMVYCVYTVVTIILAFLKYEVAVNYKIVSDSPSPFPAVTICNLNPFDFGTNQSTGTYLENIVLNNSISSKVTLTANDSAILKIQEIQRILRAHVTSDINLSIDELKSKGFTLDTMLISCFYNNEKCSSEEFSWFRDNDFGNCYTFNNLLDGLKTSKSGSDNGLKMEIFVGVSGTQDNFSVKRGIKVVIHDRGVRPLLKYDGIEVSTGAATYLAISRTNYSQQPPPYSKCRKNLNSLSNDDSNYHKYTISISKYYQKLCFEICLQYEQIVPNCGCADPNIPKVEQNSKICTSRNELSCVKEQRDYFDSVKSIDQVCGKFCPNDCDQIIYSTSISQSVYPTDYYSSILRLQENLIDRFNPPVLYSLEENLLTTISQTSTSSKSSAKSKHTENSTSNTESRSTKARNIPELSDLVSSVLMLSIYYDNLYYIRIQESPAMNFETMLSLIGGQFGLFMGASFLSFIEILEMLVNLIRVFFKHNREKKILELKFQSN